MTYGGLAAAEAEMDDQVRTRGGGTFHAKTLVPILG